MRRTASEGDWLGPRKGRAERRAPLLLAGLLAGLVVAPPLAAQQSQRPLGRSHWSYEFLEVLQAMGSPVAWTGWVEPLPAASLRTSMATVADGEAGAGERGRDAAAAWRYALEGELGASAPGAPLPGFVAGGRLGYDSGDAELREERQLFGSVGGEYRFTDRATIWAVGGGSQRSGTFDLEQGGLSFEAGRFVLAAGRMPVSLGQGTSTLLLNGQPTMDGALFATRTPFVLPTFFRYLGPTSIQLFVSPRVSNAGGGSHGTAPEGEFDSWFGSMGVAFSPHPRFQLGLMRTTRFAGDGIAEWGFGDFIRTIFLGTQNDDFDDNQGELDLRWRVPLGGFDLSTYLVMGFEDIPSIYDDPGILAGVLIPVETGAGILSIRYEFNAFGESAMWCGSCEYNPHEWYNHHIYGLYAMSDEFLGADLGGYGKAHRVELGFWSGWLDRTPIRLQVDGFWQEREPLNVLHERWPEVRKGVGLEFAVRPTSAWEISGKTVFSSVGEMSESQFVLGVQLFDLLGFPGY